MICARCDFPASTTYVALVGGCPRCGVEPFIEKGARDLEQKNVTTDRENGSER